MKAAVCQKVDNHWVANAKKILLKDEQALIQARIDHYNMIITKAFKTNNKALKLHGLKVPLCNFQPQFINFIKRWDGLEYKSFKTLPQSEKEYLKRSRNWLNGARASQYAKVFYPYLIEDAAIAAKEAANLLFGTAEGLKVTYFNLIMYNIISQLLLTDVTFSTNRHASFICQRSIKKGSNLNRRLRDYAPDQRAEFPKDADEAYSYFESKYQKEIDIFKKKCRNQSGSRTGGADAQFWKKQFMNLQRELAKEHEMRIKAETERDNLKNLLNKSAANNNMSAVIHNIHNGSIGNGSSFGSGNGLPLTNDNTFDSINGPSTTTAPTTSSSVCGGNGTTANILGDINLPNNVLGATHNNMMMNNHINTNMAMPQLQPTNANPYAILHGAPPPLSQSHCNQQSSGMPPNMQQINMANINDQSNQIDHVGQQANAPNNGRQPSQKRRKLSNAEIKSQQQKPKVDAVDKWKCASCTFENSFDDMICVICLSAITM